MGSTYLQLTNKVLRKLNEVELTSANFASATGFHSLVKDLIQYAIDDINQEERQWPFNHSSYTETCVADTATYALQSDYNLIDWSTFYLVEDASLEVSAKPLPVVDYHEWHNRYRAGEDLMDSTAIKIPALIYRTQDEKFGVSPVPDRAYSISYEYWATPTALSAYSDTTTIPSRFDRVIVSHAMMGAYDFRENYEMAGKEWSNYQRGVKNMKAILIDRNFQYAYDTRTKRVSGSRRNAWAK